MIGVPYEFTIAFQNAQEYTCDMEENIAIDDLLKSIGIFSICFVVCS